MSVTETYEYDYQGNRTSKTTGDVTFEYTVDLSSGYSQVLKATNGTDTVYYTRGFELISRHEGDASSYYLYDGGLSVRALTDEAGAVTDTLVFDAFGNETEKTGTTANTYGFQGEEQDATGLYYLRARYMDPTSGTFTSMDTYAGSLSDPMSLHKYLFANSNPVMYSDPSGHLSSSEQLLVCALIGEIASSVLYFTEYISTDNIQYNNLGEAIGGALSAAFTGIIAGILFCLLYVVFAWITTEYIATVIFGVAGFSLSGYGVLEGLRDIDNGSIALGKVKIVINAIFAVLSLFSLAKGYTNENSKAWHKADGSINYPPNNGAVPGTEAEITLEPGQKLGRYGTINDNSTFVTQAGADPRKLSLPPNTDPATYQEFRVVREIPGTTQARVAPWGNSEGGALQYDLPKPILKLINEGYLEPIKR